jgi:hypothetical protein
MWEDLMPATRIDTAALVDQSSFGKYQTWLFLLCFVAMIVDGYDVQIIGVAAAGIKEAKNAEARGQVPDLSARSPTINPGKSGHARALSNGSPPNIIQAETDEGAIAEAKRLGRNLDRELRQEAR